jgi:ribonuclease P protein component
MASAPLIILDETSERVFVETQLVSVVSDFVKKKKRRSTGKFPKSARLLSRAHYKYLHKNSIRLFGEQVFVDICQGKAFSARLGITVSRKFGKAHLRNRFKRVVREAFREIYLSLPQDLEVNISPRKNGIYFSRQEILTDLQTLLSRWT